MMARHRRLTGRAGRERRLRAALQARTARVRELEAQAAILARRPAASFDPRVGALLAISSALLVTHELDEILWLVAREAKQLFPGAGGALLFLAEADGGTLRLRAASASLLPALTQDAGRGIAGRALLAPRAILLTGPELAQAAAEVDTARAAVMRQLVGTWPPACALLAPIRHERQQIGALVLYGGADAHMLHPRDLPFLQALADLAAVAILEAHQRSEAARLQRDLQQTRSLHEQDRARLDAAQAQLLQSARLAAVGELAASVAHEINNPLYAARNSLYLIEQDLPPDAPQRPFLEIARDELGRIARIITRMRDFYRPARDELGPTDLNRLLEETLALVQVHLRHGSVQVVTDFAPGLPQPQANADQMRQVFLNLMLNACDAMPDGGMLRVTTRELPGVVQAIIADTGCGIPADVRPHLFEPFYTTKPQGTGLGLAITAHIVAQHGGQIAVDSQEGHGATFVVTLPV
jgi:two-component system NtrC family sensor kinase